MNSRCATILALWTLLACARGERPSPAPSRALSAWPPATSAASLSPSSSIAAESVPAVSASASVPPPVQADSASAPSAPAAQAPLTIQNRDGLAGLIATVQDVERVELLRWTTARPPEAFSPEAREHLKRLIVRGNLIDARAVTHPPWPVALLLRTRTHGSYAVTLVGAHNLRLDPGNASRKFAGEAARWNDSPAPEMELDDEEGWLWTYLQSRLGATVEKEYQTPPRPSYPINLR
jgi:hypothetical protein